MAFSVNTNNNAMAALRSLTSTQNNISSIQSQIESGLKIGSATDDPSTFVIAQGMRGDIGALGAVKEGLDFGKATVNMALAAATQISDQITDLQTKVTQAKNQGLDITILQSEADEMVSQITTIVTSAEFNGENLLDGGTGLDVLSGLGGTLLSVAGQDATAATLLGGATFDLTNDAAGTITLDNNLSISATNTVTVAFGTETHIFEFYEGTAALTSSANEAGGTFVHGVQIDTGTESFTQMIGTMATVMREQGLAVDVGEDGVVTISAAGNNVTVTSALAGGATDGATTGGSLAQLDAAKGTIGDVLTTLGTFANRLESQAEFTQVLSDTLEEGLGILVDANLAEVSAKLQSEQTKEQLGIQSLSIANASSQSILGLFR